MQCYYIRIGEDRGTGRQVPPDTTIVLPNVWADGLMWASQNFTSVGNELRSFLVRTALTAKTNG